MKFAARHTPNLPFSMRAARRHGRYPSWPSIEVKPAVGATYQPLYRKGSPGWIRVGAGAGWGVVWARAVPEARAIIEARASLSMVGLLATRNTAGPRICH